MPGPAPPAESSTLERAAFWLTVLTLGLVQFKLLVAQTLFGLALIAWAAFAIQRRARVVLPKFWLPLALYGAVTLVSAVFSNDPRASIIDCKQLVLFLMVPLVASVARGERAPLTLNVVMALGAAGAMVGVVEFLLLGQDTLDKRPMGLLSHYMTYSGVLMLVACAAAARLIFKPARMLWPAIAVPALLLAIVFTQSRSAWIGTIVAISVLLAIRRPRLLIAVPVLLIVVFLIAPAGLKRRAYSMVDANEPSNKDRIQMLVMGTHIVRDHPLLGVGPEMIGKVYAQYRAPDAVHPYNPHLHNVPMQIAAERGLPALAIWIWFVAVAGWECWRQLRRGPAPVIGAAGLAAIVAMITAGMFEYNFGDSEFLMLFLGLITLPFAARQNPFPTPRSAS
jgi:O-antigen ligase